MATPSAKLNSSHFSNTIFTDGFQLILVVVLPRMFSSCVVFCAACGFAMLLKMLVVARGGYTLGLYVSYISHTHSITLCLFNLLQSVVLLP